MGNKLELETLMKEGMLTEEHRGGVNWEILHGDTLKLVKAFRLGVFDAVITDPPYASGGTKQNERNRTTNQKYSSMRPVSYTHLDVYKRQWLCRPQEQMGKPSAIILIRR